MSMHNDFQSFIKDCRNAAHLTLEKAAFLLNTSPRQISNYEKGKHNVPDDIAVAMAKVYENHEIVYRWLRDNRCGQMILPDVGEQGFAESVLDVLSNINLMKENIQELIDIGKDGKIDAIEEPAFEKIKASCCIPLARSLVILSLFDKKKAELHKQLSK